MSVSSDSVELPLIEAHIAALQDRELKTRIAGAEALPELCQRAIRSGAMGDIEKQRVMTSVVQGLQALLADSGSLPVPFLSVSDLPDAAAAAVALLQLPGGPVADSVLTLLRHTHPAVRFLITDAIAQYFDAWRFSSERDSFPAWFPVYKDFYHVWTTDTTADVLNALIELTRDDITEVQAAAINALTQIEARLAEKRADGKLDVVSSRDGPLPESLLGKPLDAERAAKAAIAAASVDEGFSMSIDGDQAEPTAKSPLEPAPKPAPRWLQAHIFEIQQGDPAGAWKERRLEKAFQAGAEHRLRLWIGPDTGEKIRAQDVFPEEQLPPDQDKYELQIVFWEEKHAPKPQIDTIFLPRGMGSSTTCDFQFRARPDVPDFEARLVVMHAGRILQTMLLMGCVLPDPGAAIEETSISLRRDTPVRSAQSAFEARRALDAAVIADTGRDGKLQMASVAGQRVALRSLEGVAETIKKIRARVEEIANSPQDFGSLDSEGTKTLLRYLARQGSMLYEGIVETYLPGHPLRTPGQQIQLVSARDSYLPLEFMYDRVAPAKDANLCPKAVEALEAGKCTGCDGETEDVVRSRICPLGFWCTSRVIERHWVTPVDESDLAGAEYALEGADPSAKRDALRVLSAAVYAASGRVRAEHANALRETLVTLTGGSLQQVQDWKEWRRAVKKNPSILVLLPHTLLDEDDVPTLEIGDGQQLANTDITIDDVRGEAGAAPVVLLLGCETAVPDLPYQAFAARFRARGAAIVLSTLAPVLGRHAAPVARMVVEELKAAAEAGGTFGEAILSVRRKALAAGLPMVLTLVAAGDADWRLQGR